jgi:hypothetical protein
MAAPRLSDSQKIELVARFRAGETSQALANAYGCSTATITRAVRAVLAPEEYESLKQPPGRRPAVASEPTAPPLQSQFLPSAPGAEPLPPAVEDRDLGGEGGAVGAEIQVAEREAAEPAAAEPEQLDPEAARGVLAIDDADDFGDDEDEDDLLEEDSDGGNLAALFSQAVAAREGSALEVRPLADATLPPSAYMLVDKTVELQARPLSDFPELGPLAQEEQQRQALVMFLNPRQAKRQCGRSQRVIKIPDPRVLERTSRFLVAQGISRVLIEGALYSLPGS